MKDIDIVNEKIKIIESLCTDDCINKSTVINPLKYSIFNIIQQNNALKERNKRQQEDLKILNKKVAAQRGQLKMLNDAYIPKSKIKETLGIEEDISNEKILDYIDLLVSENNRLEDIEDKKVQIEYQNVFNKGVKSVKMKLKELREIDNIDLIQCKLKQILEE